MNNNDKEPKWVYRLESTDENNGLWYNSNAEFCFNTGIGSLDDTCKTKSLPMDYDERYRQDGRIWFSSCSRKEDLTHWYSKEDANILLNKGFIFTRYLATEYHEYEFETVFIKETALKREVIDFNDLFLELPQTITIDNVVYPLEICQSDDDIFNGWWFALYHLENELPPNVLGKGFYYYLSSVEETKEKCIKDMLERLKDANII